MPQIYFPSPWAAPHPALQMVLSAGAISAFTVALIKSEEQSAFDKKIL